MHVQCSVVCWDKYCQVSLSIGSQQGLNGHLRGAGVTTSYYQSWWELEVQLEPDPTGFLRPTEDQDSPEQGQLSSHP